MEKKVKHPDRRPHTIQMITLLKSKQTIPLPVKLLQRLSPLSPVASIIGILAIPTATIQAAELTLAQPNIVVIFADDLGYGDLTCYNKASKAPTPHLDALAKDGIRFTDGHSNAAVCTPSRYGLLTGRYSWRTRLKSGVLNGFSPSLIAAERQTIADVAKLHGYQTAMIGKWHLGMDWGKKGAAKKSEIDYSQEIKGGPLDCGFDYYFGISASLDMPPYTWIENRKVVADPTEKIKANKGPLDYWRGGAKAPDFDLVQGLPEISRRAAAYVRKQSSKQPFLMYVPFPSPHKPVLPAPEFRGKSKAGVYGDYVVQTDWAVGHIVKALKEKGFYENTLIVFTSDNGSFTVGSEKANGRYGVKKYGHAANGVLRGEKSDIWEGGHRVPFIAAWPAKVKGNQTYDGTVSTTDIMATVSDAVGHQLKDNEGEDSWSFLHAMTSQEQDVSKRVWVFHSASGMFAVRKGKWKLIAGKGAGGRGGKGPADAPAGQLYDMKNDLSETTNLYEKYPEIVEELTSELKQLVENGRSTPGENQPNTGKVRYLR